MKIKKIWKELLRACCSHWWRKRKTFNEEKDAEEYIEEKRHCTLYLQETTISETFKGSLNHGSLKYDPDKTRISKASWKRRKENICCWFFWRKDPRGNYHGKKGKRDKKYLLFKDLKKKHRKVVYTIRKKWLVYRFFLNVTIDLRIDNDHCVVIFEIIINTYTINHETLDRINMMTCKSRLLERICAKE